MSPLDKQQVGSMMTMMDGQASPPSPASTPTGTVVSPSADAAGRPRRQVVGSRIAKLQEKFFQQSQQQQQQQQQNQKQVDSKPAPAPANTAAAATADVVVDVDDVVAVVVENTPTTTTTATHPGSSSILGKNDSNNNTTDPKKKARFRPFHTTSQAEEEEGITIHTSIQFIPHFSELSQEDQESLWFTNQEMQQILQEATQTVTNMRDGVPLADDNPDFTTRGLEYMTPDGFDITTSSLDVVQLVLEEQSRQRQESDFINNGRQLDQDLIAATVGGVSRHRSRIAHLAAMMDARSVYGEGKFKTDTQAAAAAAAGAHGGLPGRSRSFDGKREPRRGMLKATGSLGAAAEKTRRRRGSRGPLERRARHSAPDATSAAAADIIVVPQKQKSSIN